MAETETHEHARTDEALETLTRWGRDPGTAAALRAVSWAKAPGVVDVILLRDGRM